ncbi:MAG: hypothetical protein II685_07775 [Clostridia bacterium]|nr:hypothetical protein [Clostridia bacterium]
MIFAGIDENGIVELPRAVTVKIEKDLEMPADEMTVVFEYCEDFPKLRKIFALDDDCCDIERAVREKNVLFSGIVDEQILSADYRKAVITVVSRSFAAVLLDNECVPIKYVNPDSDVIILKHLLPLGIECFEKNRHLRNGELTIAKGSSHYRAVEKFCREFLNTTPYVDEKGILRFDVFDGVGEVEFDNEKENAVRFRSITINESRYSKISRIYVSTAGGYDTVINDKETIDEGIVRERYLNLAVSETGTLSDADNIIKNGRKKSLSVVLECIGCLIGILGYTAAVGVEGICDKKLVVSQIRFTCDKNGERTRIRLRNYYN